MLNNLKEVASKNKDKLYKSALENTKRNEDGLTVITKDDYWREDVSNKSDISFKGGEKNG